MTFLLWVVALAGLAFCLLSLGILQIVGSLWEASEQDDRPWTEAYTRWTIPLPQGEPNQEELEVSVEETAEETSKIIVSYELSPVQELQENSLP